MQIITLDAARELGLSRYFTGKPCKHGHVAERYSATRICLKCSEMHRKARVGNDLDARRAKWAALPKSDEFREKERARARLWREKNLDRARAASRAYQQKNREARRGYHSDYREKNKEKLRQSANRAKAVRRHNPVVRLKDSASALIRASLINKGYSKSSRTHEILGCSWPEFVAHIERQFLPGMTWVNRSEWHLDHIVPLATAATEADVLALNHFTNLRPLWGKDNIRKGAKQTHLL